MEVFLLAYAPDEWSEVYLAYGRIRISADQWRLSPPVLPSSMLLVESSAIVVDIDANTFIRQNSIPVYNVYMCVTLLMKGA